MKYRELPIKDRAALIKIGVANGLHTIKDIEGYYNRFSEGGNIQGKQYDGGGWLESFGNWIKSLFNSGSGEEIKEILGPKPLNFAELASRQAYAESNFDSNAKSGVGARGMFQIMPSVVVDYNKANNTSYTTKDLANDNISIAIRNWYMNSLQNRTWNTKNNPTDSIQFAKSLAAYNYGTGNVLKALNKAKEAGLDIYGGWDWLTYMPKETQDYVNFILRNQDVNTTQKNNALYNTSTEANKDKVEAIQGSIKSTGGPIYPFSFSKQQRPSVLYGKGGDKKGIKEQDYYAGQLPEIIVNPNSTLVRSTGVLPLRTSRPNANISIPSNLVRTSARTQPIGSKRQTIIPELMSLMNTTPVTPIPTVESLLATKKMLDEQAINTSIQNEVSKMLDYELVGGDRPRASKLEKQIMAEAYPFSLGEGSELEFLLGKLFSGQLEANTPLRQKIKDFYKGNKFEDGGSTTPPVSREAMEDYFNRLYKEHKDLLDKNSISTFDDFLNKMSSIVTMYDDGSMPEWAAGSYKDRTVTIEDDSPISTIIHEYLGHGARDVLLGSTNAGSFREKKLLEDAYPGLKRAEYVYRNRPDGWKPHVQAERFAINTSFRNDLQSKYNVYGEDFNTWLDSIDDETLFNTLINGNYGYIDPEESKEAYYSLTDDEYYKLEDLNEWITNYKKNWSSNESERSLADDYFYSLDDSEEAKIAFDKFNTEEYQNKYKEYRELYDRRNSLNHTKVNLLRESLKTVADVTGQSFDLGNNQYLS